MGGLFGGGGGTQTIVKEVPVYDDTKAKENDLKKLKEKKELQNSYGNSISNIRSDKFVQDTTLSNGSLLGLSDTLGA